MEKQAYRKLQTALSDSPTLKAKAGEWQPSTLRSVRLGTDAMKAFRQDIRILTSLRCNSWRFGRQAFAPLFVRPPSENFRQVREWCCLQVSSCKESGS